MIFQKKFFPEDKVQRVTTRYNQLEAIVTRTLEKRFLRKQVTIHLFNNILSYYIKPLLFALTANVLAFCDG